AVEVDDYAADLAGRATGVEIEAVGGTVRTVRHAGARADAARARRPWQEQHAQPRRPVAGSGVRPRRRRLSGDPRLRPGTVQYPRRQEMAAEDGGESSTNEGCHRGAHEVAGRHVAVQ